MTLILTRGDVAALLTLDECIAAVEDVAAAAAVYEKAIATGRGLTVDLAS